MRGFIVLFFACAAAQVLLSSSDMAEVYQRWLSTYGIEDTPSTFQNFQNNVNEMSTVVSEYGGKVDRLVATDHSADVNQYTGLSHEQFKKDYTGIVVPIAVAAAVVAGVLGTAAIIGIAVGGAAAFGGVGAGAVYVKKRRETQAHMRQFNNFPLGSTNAPVTTSPTAQRRVDLMVPKEDMLSITARSVPHQ